MIRTETKPLTRFDFILESNRIEGMHGVLAEDIEAHDALWSLDELTVADVSNFVKLISLGKLRDKVGRDVMVGTHKPISGGPDVSSKLFRLLGAINTAVDERDPLEPISPFLAHIVYETLHPFTDGNGRSGRAIWAWHLLNLDLDPFSMGFLHHFYYELKPES